MAKKSKVSIDDFAFFDEEEQQPLNIIARSIQKVDSTLETELGQSLSIPLDGYEISVDLTLDKQSTNDPQTDNKKIASDLKINDKALAYREQSVSNASPKALATREQSVSKALAGEQKKSESVSNASPKALATREQSVSKALAEDDILGLIGKEKKLLFYIFQKCEAIGALETPIITTEELLKLLDVSSVRLRNLIFRLQEEKHLIKVTQVHFGRSGWRRFSLDKDVFQIIRINLTSSKALAYREQSVSNASPKALAYPLAEPPYSSSNNLNINTNTISTDILSIPENLRRLGISVVNLQNLINSGKTTHDVVERSLAALSFDVENGKAGNLANILFGVLGTGREYISQKYSEALQKELDEELTRIQQAEESQRKIAETKLQIRFKEFLSENPTFLETIRERNKSFVQTQELLEKMAFEEFKNLEVNL